MIQKNPRWPIFLIVVMVVISCEQLSEITTISPSKNPVIPTISTSTPKATMTPSRIPVASITPKSVPALPFDEAQKQLLDLLNTNGDCDLPCLWGITPGLSNQQDARNILMPLSSISPQDKTYFDSTALNGVLFGTISPLHFDEKYRFNSLVVYRYSDNGIIHRISFRAMEEQILTDSNGNLTGIMPIYDSSAFIKRTEYYSLHHLLSEQGMPESVAIYTSGNSHRGGSIKIDIAVFYPNQGIWAQYETYVNEFDVEDVIKICPLHTHVEMELYPPGDPDSFYSHLDQTNWRYIKGGAKPLEEAASMSIEEFYQTFRDPTDQCFETPVDIWPPPS
ncbi:MAG TPA: hypothetical protein PLA27_10270 [Anaerolineales bacterium]|jgi:hypothetical protein|nr:hypothetical protein [Anaerolineales bacterium]